jgi:hypothetical protein
VNLKLGTGRDLGRRGGLDRPLPAREQEIEQRDLMRLLGASLDDGLI